jgi:hypothetical protein
MDLKLNMFLDKEQDLQGFKELLVKLFGNIHERKDIEIYTHGWASTINEDGSIDNGFPTGSYDEWFNALIKDIKKDEIDYLVIGEYPAHLYEKLTLRVYFD